MSKRQKNNIIILAIIILVCVAEYFILKQNFVSMRAPVTPVSTSTINSTESYSVLEQDPLIESYGEYPSLVFKNHLEILESLKQLDSKFTDYDMDVSFGKNKVVAFMDGRKMLLLYGCFPHACGGSEKMVLYDPVPSRVYLSTYVFTPKYSDKPNLGGKNTIVFLGDPDPLPLKFLSENYKPVFLFPDTP